MAIEISESEHQTYLKNKSELEVLRKELKESKTENINKASGIAEERQKRKQAEEEVESLKLDNELKTSTISEMSQKYQDYDDIKSESDKWRAQEEQIKEARTQNIENLKNELGEEFVNSKAGFLDGLDDEKVEAYLSEQSESKKSVNTTVGVDNNNAGMQQYNQNNGMQSASRFEQAIQAGDLDLALSEIPTPGNF